MCRRCEDCGGSVLQACKALISLNVEENGMSDDGLHKLARSITKHCPTLQTFIVRGNEFAARSAKNFAVLTCGERPIKAELRRTQSPPKAKQRSQSPTSNDADANANGNPTAVGHLGPVEMVISLKRIYTAHLNLTAVDYSWGGLSYAAACLLVDNYDRCPRIQVCSIRCYQLYVCRVCCCWWAVM